MLPGWSRLIVSGLVLLGLGGMTSSRLTAEVPVLVAKGVVRVRSDGTVLTPNLRREPSEATDVADTQIRYQFVFPARHPAAREFEAPRVPIAHTHWETNQVRYTQTVLLTRLWPGDLMPDGKLAEDAVLLVRLFGENTAEEYTEATAAFSVQVAGRSLDLELEGALAYATARDATSVVAVVDIAAGGVAAANGTVLRFAGNMPPGTSGSMDIKIPLRPLRDERAVNRLRDLEYDEEFRRVKRYWNSREETGELPVAPVDWDAGD